jgi:thiamine biosynthesis protein ThiS
MGERTGSLSSSRGTGWVKGKVRILVNGEERRLEPGLSVQGLLDLLGVKGSHIAVARNQDVVPRSEYPTVPLEEGDRIEIIHAVGGGAH